MCEDTKARIRVLEGPVGNPDRIVLISGKEETEASLSPAMDAVIRVFKRVNGFPEDDDDGVSIRSLLLVSTIGTVNASPESYWEARVFDQDNTGGYRLFYEVSTLHTNSDDIVVDLQGEALKVLKALEAVVGHLRKFLIDYSVLPQFEKTHNATATKEHQVDAWAEPMVHNGSHNRAGSDFPLSMKSESLFLDREPQQESRAFSSGLLFYGRDPGLQCFRRKFQAPPRRDFYNTAELSATRSPILGPTSGRFVTQVAQTMQTPLAYAEDIIGVGGRNVTYIRRTSGAILTVQEGLLDEIVIVIVIEIKGTSSQVQVAQQLIQECVNSHKEPVPSDYSNMDLSVRYSHSRFVDSSYSQYSYGESGFHEHSNYRI
ncbi:hypothetical protein L1987_01732 [Smallanthus sonchifolius]|uniref:Uncharacterized protein n=1 Tax=Smallanthus sonchifolius TaxID=185202 RepID=A0ACB9K5X2_9ASTR|nr:hypothetical protein L1987_01732 [Smallanthus sonchifolius]